MVQFGRIPSPGTILQAGNFLAEELPVRLAHRVKELDELPNGLNEMPSIVRVKNWYAQSFEVCPPPFDPFHPPRSLTPSCGILSLSIPFPQELVHFPKPKLPESIQKQLAASATQNAAGLSSATPNPTLSEEAETMEEGTAAQMARSAAASSSADKMKRRALAIAAGGSEGSGSSGNGYGNGKYNGYGSGNGNGNGNGNASSAAATDGPLTGNGNGTTPSKKRVPLEYR